MFFSVLCHRQPPPELSQRRRTLRRRPGAGHARGLRLAAGGNPRARHGGGAGLCHQLLPRPPLRPRPSQLVFQQARRHHKVRRKPAQEIPGRLPPQLSQRGLAQPLAGTDQRHPILGRTRGEDFPGRQPPHQASGVLGVSHPQGAGGLPRRRLPLRGLHQTKDDARPRQGRVHPELHLLHLAQLQARAHRVFHPTHPAGHRRLLPPKPLAKHPGHPPRPAPNRRTLRLPDARGPRSHPVTGIRNLFGVRALRKRRAAQQGGVP